MMKDNNWKDNGFLRQYQLVIWRIPKLNLDLSKLFFRHYELLSQ